MTYRLLLRIAAVLAIGACSEAPTTSSETGKDPSFITNGELDGNAHPAVVLIVADVGGTPNFRCSGTLISPKRVVTAGHCTHNGAGEPLITGMRIFTESDVENGKNNFPFAGPNTVEAASWHAHPLFPTAPFFVNDVGIIKLKKAVNLPSSQYGALPRLNQLDALSPSSSTRFTAVGYGLQRSNPVFVVADLIRMKAEPHLLQINVPGFTGDFSLLLSNNASTGGTCFGDSGGPNYLGRSNVIAAVTSFGINNNCAGTGGVFRLDRANVLDFLEDHLE
jgi:Trypsin